MPTKQRVRRTGNLSRGEGEQPALRRPIEVVIVCRAELLLLGLERLLVQAPDLKVFTYSSLAGGRSCGSVSSAASGPSTHSRVVLLSDRQAEEPVQQCERALESLADEVVVLFSRPDLDLLVGCMAAGARGFVMEGDPPPMLLAAIRSAAAGKTYVGQRTLDLLVDWLAQQERGVAANRAATRTGFCCRDCWRREERPRTLHSCSEWLPQDGAKPRLDALQAAWGAQPRRCGQARLEQQRGLLDGGGRAS